MIPDGAQPQDSLGGSPREERLGELINEYFDRCERGEKLSKDEFLAKYPEYAAELREHLSGLDLIADLGSSVGGATLPRAMTPKPRGSSADDPFGPAEQHLPAIPGYEIHKQIGRGGMGIVYKAVQLSTRRVVALKLLLEGPFAADGARKRFEREISLAAQLRHSNIIPIYDSGNADGRLFYAMEHVYGMSLTDHIRANLPDIPTRLRLFAKICQAVGHAHLRGVIHRDLKPSNILVDGAGEPHILDFGLAKAGTFGDTTTSITAQIVGTPAYMSPEQASGDPGGIDIRTDVYSLGVILYEMLTGEMPYETNVAMGRILHNIAHAEPKPPGKVNTGVDGELSAIVLKSLEKNKDARYQSADALATDVQHYLAGEPISAQPPSSIYLLKKVIYKHRVVIGIAAFLVVVTTIGLLTIRQFSKNLAVKEQQAKQAAEENQRLQDQLKAKQTADDEARQKREIAQKQLDATLRTLPPEMRGRFEALAKDAAAVVGGDVAAPSGVMDLLQQLAAGLSAQDAPGPTKKTDVDPSIWLRSERPRDDKADRSKASGSVDSARKTLFSAVQSAIDQYKETVAAEAASSQPATTTRPTSTTPPTGNTP